MRVEPKSFSKEDFERSLKKFRRVTKEIVLEVERRRFYERPQEERNRIRRKEQKRKSNRKALIKQHGRDKYQSLVDIGLIDRTEY